MRHILWNLRGGVGGGIPFLREEVTLCAEFPKGSAQRTALGPLRQELWGPHTHFPRDSCPLTRELGSLLGRVD